METQSDTTDEIANIKEIRQQIQTRIETLRNSQLEVISSLQYGVVPDISSSLDLHLKVVSSFNGRPFTPLPNPLPAPNPNTKRRIQPPPPAPTIKISKLSDDLHPLPSAEGFTADDGGSGTPPLSTVRLMVAVCLLERVPFTKIDSASILSKLESDGFQSVTAVEKAVLREVAGGDSILAVEMALRSMAEDNGGVQLEEFKSNGKFRVSVKRIDKTKLVKEFPQFKLWECDSTKLWWLDGARRPYNGAQGYDVDAREATWDSVNLMHKYEPWWCGMVVEEEWWRRMVVVLLSDCGGGLVGVERVY